MSKTFLKTGADAVALLLVLPAVAACHVGMRLAGPERGFAGWSQLLSLLPGFTGIYLRSAFYRCVLRKYGRGAAMGFGTVLSQPSASIGANVHIGNFCVLGDVTLEDDVLIASRVSVMNGLRQHGIDRLDLPVREQPGVYEPITIGTGAWIGEGAIIAASVGRQAVIGAGAVVIAAVPDCAIAAGVPAQVLKVRSDASAARMDGNLQRVRN